MKSFAFACNFSIMILIGSRNITLFNVVQLASTCPRLHMFLKILLEDTFVAHDNVKQPLHVKVANDTARKELLLSLSAMCKLVTETETETMYNNFCIVAQDRELIPTQVAVASPSPLCSMLCLFIFSSCVIH